MTRTSFRRLRLQQGFTLIELLVVILIIGILAAVAIPTFLSQTNKAKDSNVQAALAVAQTAEKSYLTTNGTFVATSGTGSSNPLLAIDPSLTTAFTSTTASSPGFGMTVTGVSSSGYTITAIDVSDGITYTVQEAAGVVTRNCVLTAGGSAAGKGGCNASSTWGS